MKSKNTNRTEDLANYTTEEVSIARTAIIQAKIRELRWMMFVQDWKNEIKIAKIAGLIALGWFLAELWRAL